MIGFHLLCLSQYTMKLIFNTGSFSYAFLKFYLLLNYMSHALFKNLIAKFNRGVISNEPNSLLRFIIILMIAKLNFPYRGRKENNPGKNQTI